MEAVHNETAAGRARSYYGITAAGRTYLEKTWEEYQEIEKVFRHLMDGGRAMPHNPAIRAYCRQVRRGLELPGSHKRHLLRGSGA